MEHPYELCCVGAKGRIELDIARSPSHLHSGRAHEQWLQKYYPNLKRTYINLQNDEARQIIFRDIGGGTQCSPVNVYDNLRVPQPVLSTRASRCGA
ncbi:hypothetical protein AB1N83_005854 [Pleurotus pulmonarius]